MKINRLYGPLDFRMDEAPLPECGPGMVRVRTECCGICGSDIARGLKAEVPFLPSTLGHEFCARVDEVGEGVENFSKGELVQVVPLIVCHKCRNCINGNYGQCVSKKFIGLRVPDMGGFAEYNVLPAENLIKLPQGMKPEKAAFVEPVTIALQGLRRIEFKPGRDIAIIGTGMIGQLTIQCARAMGARKIFVFDINDQKLAAAKEYGADYCYNTMKEGFLEQYLADTDGFGVEQVLEIVGLESTTMLAIDICAVCGRVGIVGLLGKSITFDAPHMRRFSEQQITLVGVWQSYSIGWPGEGWELAIEYLHKDIVDISKMIHRVNKMEEANEVFAEFGEHPVEGKSILTF